MTTLAQALSAFAAAMKPATCGRIIINSPESFYEAMAILAARANRLEERLAEAEWNLKAARDFSSVGTDGHDQAVTDGILSGKVDFLPYRAGDDLAEDQVFSALQWIERRVAGAPMPPAFTPAEKAVEGAILNLERLLNRPRREAHEVRA